MTFDGVWSQTLWGVDVNERKRIVVDYTLNKFGVNRRTKRERVGYRRSVTFHSVASVGINVVRVGVLSSLLISKCGGESDGADGANTKQQNGQNSLQHWCGPMGIALPKHESNEYE